MNATQPHPLESLLAQHCPNGVEFKELQEICKLQAGDRIIKSMMNDKAKYPVMGGGTEPTGYYHDYNFNQAITIARAGSAGYVAWQEGKFWATDVCFVAILPISHCETSARKSRQSTNTKSKQMDCHEFDKSNSRNNKAILKFVFYVLKANEYELKKHLYGGSMPKLDKNYLWSFPIPLPPLPVQEKIVEILDKFTQLQAELQARRKQYEYYRNKLLNFEELQRRTDMLNGGGLKLVTLGEIGTFTRGNGLTKSDFVEVGVPCIHYGQIHTHYHNYTHSTTSFVSEEKARKLKKAKCGDLVIAGVSEDKDCVCKAVVYLGKQEACVSGDTFIFSHSQNPKFIGYMFQTENFNTFKHKYAQGAKVLRVHNKHLENFQIPLPPLEVQNEIVEILDKFDTLANDLSAGLPAEIEMRKKQYEYYRERLLDFR